MTDCRRHRFSYRTPSKDMDECLSCEHLYACLLKESVRRTACEKETKDMGLKEAIAAADKCRSEIVLCLLGAPGIGKTQAVYEFARENGRRVVEIIASQILPNEVSGITMPVQETKSMEVFDHARLSSLRDGDILFFDELLQASPTTLSACLTLIQERRLLSGKKLPDVLIVAAANPQASANLTPLSIRQRFMFYECRWDADAWTNWIKKELGYKVSPRLLSRIKVSGDDMNVLTPRTAAKLLRWIKDSGGDEAVYDAIGNMFDDQLAAAMRKVAEDGDPIDLIVDKVAEFYAGSSGADEIVFFDEGGKPQRTVDVEELRDCTADELLEVLSNLPEWDQVRKMLEAEEIEEEL